MTTAETTFGSILQLSLFGERDGGSRGAREVLMFDLPAGRDGAACTAQRSVAPLLYFTIAGFCFYKFYRAIK